MHPSAAHTLSSTQRLSLYALGSLRMQTFAKRERNMDMNRSYRFEVDGKCLDPEEPIRRFAHDWSFRIRVAKSDHGWHYGMSCTCDTESSSYLPNELQHTCRSLREAIYRAAMEAHGFFVKYTYTDDSAKRKIANEAIKRIKAIIRDYSQPSKNIKEQ